MKLSARNKFIGKVTDVTRGAVNGIVKIELSNGQHITSSITLEAIDDLDITVGKEITAIIKSTSVLISVPKSFNIHSGNYTGASIGGFEIGSNKCIVAYAEAISKSNSNRNINLIITV